MKFSRVGGVVLGVILAGVLAGFFTMKGKANDLLARTFEVHKVDFPVPFPLTEKEISELPANTDPAKVANERAIERGKHLVEAFYACQECHGKGFGGGTMVDDPVVGHFFGVNITSGNGGQVKNYTVQDWDGIVRHGVKPDGKATIMPSVDFEKMSDHELSDIIAFVRSAAPVDKEVPRPTYGPIGYVLIATGKFQFSADLIDHKKAHAVEPPAVQADANYGQHAAAVCVGCHGQKLAGGPIVGGPPDWPPAANLTQHEDGLKGWSIDDFKKAMREGKRRNGQPMKAPMDSITAFAKNWSETETQAIWAYLQSLPPTPSPK